MQVGFVVRLEGHRLTADLEDELPDFEFAFESSGALAGCQQAFHVASNVGYCARRSKQDDFTVMTVATQPQTSAPLSRRNGKPSYAVSPVGGDGEGYGAYYRSERTRALDERFGDMLHKIQDLEVRQAPQHPTLAAQDQDHSEGNTSDTDTWNLQRTEHVCSRMTPTMERALFNEHHVQILDAACIHGRHRHPASQ